METTNNLYSGAAIDYMRWLFAKTGLVGYDQLLNVLFTTDFYAEMNMDINRCANGVALRDRYRNELELPVDCFSPAFYKKQCSVLEMIVGLAIDLEERILYNTNYGDRTARWINEMLCNLGLMSFSDKNFDDDAVYGILWRLMVHSYRPDGFGGLFWLPNSGVDLRNLEIWEQALIYAKIKLNE